MASLRRTIEAIEAVKASTASQSVYSWSRDVSVDAPSFAEIRFMTQRMSGLYFV